MRRPTRPAGWVSRASARCWLRAPPSSRGEPFGVNVATDEIAFFPMLYWPVLADGPATSRRTLAKIDAYMKQGGMIIFDTRNYGQACRRDH